MLASFQKLLAQRVASGELVASQTSKLCLSIAGSELPASVRFEVRFEERSCGVGAGPVKKSQWISLQCGKTGDSGYACSMRQDLTMCCENGGP